MGMRGLVLREQDVDAPPPSQNPYPVKIAHRRDSLTDETERRAQLIESRSNGLNGGNAQQNREHLTPQTFL